MRGKRRDDDHADSGAERRCIVRADVIERRPQQANPAERSREPGHDTDYISFTLASYHREARLTGGNLQLHRAKNGRGPSNVAMEVTP
jgi:hypothetical protein